ncbi:MAG: response regulator [Alteraurantiacibacter sp.]
MIDIHPLAKMSGTASRLRVLCGEGVTKLMPNILPNILIVEDEILIACDMQDTLEDHGYHCVGIAPDLKTAEQYFDTELELALVDLNLRDGLTGPEIGLKLSTVGVPVIFITANPSQIGDGVAGTVGVLTKPTDQATLLAAVRFALGRKMGQSLAPPATMKLFG